MQHRSSLASLSLLCVALTASSLRAQAPSPELGAILAQMNAASKNFKNATADFQWDFTEKVAGITDTSRQKGSMFIERAGAGVNFGASVFDLESGSPGKDPSKIINFSDGTALIYSPAEKQADRLKAGSGRNNAESFLSLGFGGSGHDLAQAWQITDGGPVTLTEAGHPVKTEKLVLVSKDPGVRSNFKQVTIWVDLTRDVSLKQVFDTPSGDERTANYMNIRVNGKVNKDPFKIPSKGVSIVDH